MEYLKQANEFLITRETYFITIINNISIILTVGKPRNRP